MKRKRQNNIEPTIQTKPKLLIAQVIFICLLAFLSPLIAGKMTAIPALSMQLLVLVCVLIWMIRAAKQGAIEVPGGGIAVITAVFFVLLVASAIDTASLYSTLAQLANMTSYLLIFLMVAGLKSNRAAVLSILASLLLSGTIVGALGLKEYALSGSSGWRIFSTFFNPDYLAGFMVLILPIILAWYLSRVSTGIAFVAGLSVLLVFANIIMSGSRLGALTAIGGLAVFLLLALASKSLKRMQILRLGIILIPAVIMFLMLGKPLANRVTTATIKAESHSGGFRIYTWQGTARMAEANPINGTGLGTFEVAYPKYALVGYTKLAHNSYLQLAAEAGPAAGILLIVLLAASTIPAVLRRKTEQDMSEPSWIPESGLMLSGLIGGAAASMARNLVDSDWYVTAIGLSFWIVLGAVVALGHPKPFKNLRWGSKQLSISLLIILVASIGLLRMIKAEKYYALGSALWIEDPNMAVESFQKAIKLAPCNAEYHRRLGNTYFMFAKELDEISYADKAETELCAAIRLEPTSAKTYYQLGRVYEFYPKNDAAIKAFTKAIEMSPSTPELLLALAQRYEEAGKHKNALAIWKKMVQVEDSPYAKVRAIPEYVEPEYIFAHLALGQECERNGDKSGAVKEYRLALDRTKLYLDSMKAMGKILEVSGMRDVEMEDQVSTIRDDLIQRLKVSDQQGGNTR